MLKKKSGLTYCQVRERYENFRARCNSTKKVLFTFKKLKKEKGCTEPLYGKKAKCVIHIIPQERKCKTLKIDHQCIKKHVNHDTNLLSIELLGDISLAKNQLLQAKSYYMILLNEDLPPNKVKIIKNKLSLINE